ncbi:MAG TPA: hypothetical protein PKE20_04860 [Promineifilum sp.]|nr:hypothetical protein [Promineifilum sp.]
MKVILQELSTPALVNAIEANLFDFFIQFSHWPRAELHDDPDLLWLTSDIVHPLFNSCLRQRFSSDDVDATIETTIARYRAINMPTLWYIGPTTTPADLGARLTQHGFIGQGEAAGMAADLNDLNEDIPIPPGFTIEKVIDTAKLRTWSRPVAVAFEMPDFVIDALIELYDPHGVGAGMPLDNYVGWLDGEPVASSSVYYGAGVAGIYNVATVPEARRKGIGALMTLTPLLEARSAGYRAGILHSSEMGANVYRRLGFQEYCSIEHYAWLPRQEE